jgi:cobalt-precorrin-5B (C1)-methyltransferase
MNLTDPVNNFQIPQEWLDRVDMPPRELADGVRSGLIVVLSNGEVLHRGFTTGTTSAAAAKASVLSLKEKVDSITVPTPSGIRAQLEVKSDNGTAEVTKIPGDHKSDVTGGLVVKAEARPAPLIELIAGPGIGTVTRGGLQLEAGRSAINPVPHRQILDAICEAVEKTGLEGAIVTLSVPDGRIVGIKTLNPKLGVEGGISILGTTGFVEPWGDHLGETKMDLIKGVSSVVLTTGRIGMRYSQMLFPGQTVVMVGSRIDEGVKASEGKIVICGLPGLVLKWAVPDILKGTGFNTVLQMIQKDRGSPIIDRALGAAVEKAGGGRIILLDRKGKIIRDTEVMS